MHNFGGDVSAMDSHVLVNTHSRGEEEILDVAGAEMCAVMSIRNDAVEMKFGVGETDGGRADVLKSVELVAADSETDAIDLGLVGTDGTDKIGVSHFVARWDLGQSNEGKSVVAFDRGGFCARFGDAL